MFIISFILFSLINAQSLEKHYEYEPMTAQEFNETCKIVSHEEWRSKISPRIKEVFNKKCDAGQYYAMEGDVLTCTHCSPGTYLRDNYACCQCSEGSISNDHNLPSCQPCEQGYQANKERTKCEICPYGTYSTGKGMGCTPCADYQYTKNQGATYCLDCPKGQTRNKEGNGCVVCPPGTKINSKGFGCDKCTNGTYSTEPGSRFCTACPAGQGSNSERTECDECFKGMVSEYSGTGCHFCEGFASLTKNPGLSVCEPCEVAQFFDSKPWYRFDETGHVVEFTTNHIDCNPCPAGYYGKEKGKGCIKCPRGTISEGTQNQYCKACQPNNGPNHNNTNCEICPKGSRSVSVTIEEGIVSGQTQGFECQYCGDGYISQGGSSECIQCPKGQGRNQDGDKCIKCPAGTYSTKDGEGCLKCPYGTISTTEGSESCTPCEDGKESNFERTACRICTKGFFWNSTSRGCSPCQGNQYTDSDDQRQCKTCPYGSGVNSYHTECNKCPSGTYSDVNTNGQCLGCGKGSKSSEGSDKCTKCPAGTDTNDKGDDCIPCKPGYYSNETGIGCSKCPEGRYSNQEVNMDGMTKCHVCPHGSGANEDQSGCIVCKEGYYANNETNGICKICDDGKFSEKGAIQCSLCPKGTGSNVDKTGCISCQPGTYSQKDGDGCIPCATGHYSTKEKSTSCTACPKGYGENKARTGCEICPIGTYSNAIGSGCIKCLENYYSNTIGAEKCEPCPAGWEGSVDGTECFKCKKGYFSETKGTKCLKCKDGYYSSSVGSTKCEMCGPGTQSNDNLDGCRLCNEGRYSNATTEGNCEFCEGIYFNNVTGGTKCDFCPPGTEPKKNSHCKECPPGTYSPTGDSLCLPCPVNTYSNTFRSIECKSCPTGLTTDGNVGQTSCKCPVGCVDCIASSSNDKSQRRCTSCLGGYAFMNGKCQPCDAGYFSIGGISVCENCPNMTWSLTTEKSCRPCPDNCITCSQSSGYCVQCKRGFKIIRGGFCKLVEVGQYVTVDGDYAASSECSEGYYQNKTGQEECIKCNSVPKRNCKTCDRYNGQCTSCEKGWKLSVDKDIGSICTECPVGTYTDRTQLEECLKCSKGTYQPNSGQGSCETCPRGYYQDEEGKTSCKMCDYQCRSGCDAATGKCLDCVYGYELSETGVCVPCKPGNYSDYLTKGKCVPCPVGTYCNDKDGCKKCQKCYGNTYSSTEGSTECKSCDESCKTCDNTNGNCLSCQNGYGINADGKCEKCKTNEYSKNYKCQQCLLNTVYDSNSGKCECEAGKTCSTPTCENNKIVYNYECVFKHEIIPNCEVFSDDYSNCTKCYSPYHWNEKTKQCEECQPNYHYNGTECVMNSHMMIHVNGTMTIMNLCLEQIGDVCYRCDISYLVNGKCQMPDSACHSFNDKRCEECGAKDVKQSDNTTIKVERNVYSTNGKCGEISNCSYSIQGIDGQECYECAKEFENVNGTCVKNENCTLFVENTCVETSEPNMFYNTKNKQVEKCVNADLCRMINDEMKIFKCSEGYYKEGENCVKFETSSNVKKNSQNGKCRKIENDNCVECETGNYLSKGKCLKNTIPNCETQISIDECIKCQNDYLLINGKCISKNETGCHGDGKCPKCSNNETLENNYYKNVTGCIEKSNKTIIKEILACETYDLDKEELVCKYCPSNYVLVSGKCKEQNSLTNVDKTSEDCLERAPGGCTRCKNEYYLNDKGICVKCPSSCKYCFNSTYCTKCDQYSRLVDGKCEPMNELIQKCQKMWPNNQACVLCQDGYRKSADQRTCDKCHDSCITCQDDVSCQTCKDGYFKIPDSDMKLCEKYDKLENCAVKSQAGCTQCVNGFYLDKGKCHKCSKECKTCTKDICQTCVDDYVLKDQKCIHFSSMQNCKAAKDSKCTKCEDGYELNENGNECNKPLNVGLIVGLSVGGVILVAIVIFIVILIVMLLIHKKNEAQRLSENNILQLKNLNCDLLPLNDLIVASKDIANFNEEIEEIPVNEETRITIIVGNVSNKRQRVSISAKEGSDKYEIRSSPEIISLKKGEACEFEIFINPLCSTEMDDEITIVAVDMSKGDKTTIPMKMTMRTAMSTRLDYDELVEEKKLGEGSFGIVFLGSFRGNKVAIKKMKLVGDDASLEEFEKEVAMLDKFRSEYIVHFYGAVFIPNKMSMVTEFAPYGNLADLMKKTQDLKERPSEKMRVKFMLDGAKGIRYLHDNGILHRDIKPDNFLVLSVESNIAVNCKLTDFGSARNVTAMSSKNMTFTKGIGTPVYMAIEVMNQDKYGKPADIYSFGIMMFESFGWREAFPKEQFRYPWKIAEYVVDGHRPIKHDDVSDSQYALVEKCWCQDPDDRLEIHQIVDELEKEFEKYGN